MFEHMKEGMTKTTHEYIRVNELNINNQMHRLINKGMNDETINELTNDLIELIHELTHESRTKGTKDETMNE